MVALCCTAMLLAACGSGNTVAPPATTTVTVGSPASSSVGSSPATTSSAPSRVFDSGAMADSVKKILTDNYKIADVSDVSCPSGQEVRDGAKFDCAVTVGGKAEKVTITTTGDNGDYQVSAPA
jgi:hypothetical protein